MTPEQLTAAKGEHRRLAEIHADLERGEHPAIVRSRYRLRRKEFDAILARWRRLKRQIERRGEWNAAAAACVMVTTKGELTQRLHTACLTLSCMAADGPSAFFSTWPRFRLEWYDAEELGSHRTDAAVTKGLIAPPLFTPTPKQVDDCLPALSLLDETPWIMKRIVMLRAHQIWYGRHAAPDDEDHAKWRGGWRAIGAMCKRSYEGCRIIHAQAITHAFERFLKTNSQCRE